MFVGDSRVAGIAPDDRTLAYGDGLFETMRAHRGTLPWWDAHWRRLQLGATALRIPLPQHDQVHAQALRLLDGGDGVLKLQLGRGSGGRGYAPPTAPVPTWILSRHPLPPVTPAGGLVLRWCDTRLSLQPLLAGLKHCNRLEQVLARLEWQAEDTTDGDADEGLMRSTEGDVVSATAANLFVLHGRRWRTPLLDRCGVAGTCRRWLLDHFDIETGRLSVTDIETADAVVLTNAVRGILPVARLGKRRWSPHPAVAEWHDRLGHSHAAFAAADRDPRSDRPSSPMELP